MKELFEVFESSMQSMLEAGKKLTDLNLRTIDMAMQQQADLAGIYLDHSLKGLELAGKSKGFQDLLTGQAGLMRECGERCMESARKAVELATESRNQYGVLAEENVKLMQSQMARISSVTLKAAA
jgi:hypothetical protein